VSVHLSLHATVVRLLGYAHASPPKAIVRVELRDPGQLAVIRLRRLRNQELMSMSITGLQLTTNNQQVDTGGHVQGGGLGIRGAVVGMAAAGALNAMTRQRHEHTLLTVTETLPNGARRQATFALPTLSESQLRDQLAAAMDAWADGYLAAAIRTPDPLGCGDDLQGAYAHVDRMRHQGMLTPVQALTLSSYVSQPFIVALVERLDAGKVPFQEAQQLTEHITGLERDHRITSDQTQQVHDRLIAIPAPPSSSPGGRIAQIQALAELRQTGALTEAEFQAEKRRILHQAE
jgi:hypothetical protein